MEEQSLLLGSKILNSLGWQLQTKGLEIPIDHRYSIKPSTLLQGQHGHDCFSLLIRLEAHFLGFRGLGSMSLIFFRTEVIVCLSDWC